MGNRASIPGEDQLNARRLAEGFPVYGTPLQWLQERRLGVVVIDAKRAAPKLRDAAPLLATSYEHGMTLRAMLKAKAAYGVGRAKPRPKNPPPCATRHPCKPAGGT
jgi:hypothetical protein